MGKRSGRKRHNDRRNPSKKVKKQWKASIIPEENQLFKDYYHQQLNLPKEQFENFWAVMKEKLPVVFRVNPNCPNHEAFCNRINDQQFMKKIVPFEEEEKNEKELHEPKEMPKLQLVKWYPGNIVYTLNTTKQTFKKSKVLSQFHKYLQKSFDSGLISRQQLVSMLPPLYLNINSDDIVLDMCAAPGSKTSQILQMIYGEKRWLAKGCVIANDADYSRAQMLIHQLHRSGTAGMAVINHPGQFLPELYDKQVGSMKFKFQFDKILCDVPCSGDGATRKLPIKWAKWHTSDGMVLHPLQLSIVMKAVNLLKKGGYLVYSTCSLNPIENEAVINALFSKVNCGLELIDVHPMFGVKGRRGILNWKVYTVGDKQQKKEQKEEIEINEEKQIQNKVKELLNEKELQQVKNFQFNKKQQKVKETMFPPSIEEAKKIGLDNTMRILPHDQNSGGFYVALLKKHDNFQWKYAVSKSKVSKDQAELQKQFLQENQPKIDHEMPKEEDEEQIVNNEKEESEESEQEKEEEEEIQKMDEMKQKIEQAPKKVKGSKYQTYQNMDENEFKGIQNFFGLDDSMRNLLYVREDINARKKVLLVSEGIRNFLKADKTNKIKLVNMGCQVFQKGKQSFAGPQCLYRLCQDGIHFLLDFIKFRKVKVPFSFFQKAISNHSIAHEQIQDIQIKEKIKSMSQGSFCVYIEEQINGKAIKDVLVGQNFKNSFHILVSKQDTASLGMRYL